MDDSSGQGTAPSFQGASGTEARGTGALCAVQAIALSADKGLLMGVALPSSWLSAQGVSPAMAAYWCRRGVLGRLAHGLFYAGPNRPDWLGLVFGLQYLCPDVHVGGETALELAGFFDDDASGGTCASADPCPYHVGTDGRMQDARSQRCERAHLGGSFHGKSSPLPGRRKLYNVRREPVSLASAVLGRGASAGGVMNPSQGAWCREGQTEAGGAAPRVLCLIAPPSRRLPSWFEDLCPRRVLFVRTRSLEAGRGLCEASAESFVVRCSCPERAMLEVCMLGGRDVPAYDQALMLMTRLVRVDAALLQELLEMCGSIVARRLFLHLARRAGHAWVEALDWRRIDLGKGSRSLVRGGRYDWQTRLVVPADEES